MNYLLKNATRAILEPLAIVISLCTTAEELWSILGHEGSIALVPFPVLKPFSRKRERISGFLQRKNAFYITLPLDLTKNKLKKSYERRKNIKTIRR
jgi:leucyl-tRNA synthetase